MRQLFSEVLVFKRISEAKNQLNLLENDFVLENQTKKITFISISLNFIFKQDILVKIHLIYETSDK